MRDNQSASTRYPGQPKCIQRLARLTVVDGETSSILSSTAFESSGGQSLIDSMSHRVPGTLGRPSACRDWQG